MIRGYNKVHAKDKTTKGNRRKKDRVVAEETHVNYEEPIPHAHVKLAASCSLCNLINLRGLYVLTHAVPASARSAHLGIVKQKGMLY